MSERTMNQRERTLALQAMRTAQRRGVNPYDSQPSQAKSYRCVWQLAAVRVKR